jgi:heme O synthase-like polyprenyltransferase
MKEVYYSGFWKCMALLAVFTVLSGVVLAFREKMKADEAILSLGCISLMIVGSSLGALACLFGDIYEKWPPDLK